MTKCKCMDLTLCSKGISKPTENCLFSWFWATALGYTGGEIKLKQQTLQTLWQQLGEGPFLFHALSEVHTEMFAVQ